MRWALWLSLLLLTTGSSAMNNKKKTWADYQADKAAAIARASGGDDVGEEAVGLTLMKQERGFEDTPKKKGAPDWLANPPEGYKVVKAQARDAQQAINKAKQGHPATGAGQPGGSYYEKTSAGYTGYALVPAN